MTTRNVGNLWFAINRDGHRDDNNRCSSSISHSFKPHRFTNISDWRRRRRRCWIRTVDCRDCAVCYVSQTICKCRQYQRYNENCVIDSTKVLRVCEPDDGAPASTSHYVSLSAVTRKNLGYLNHCSHNNGLGAVVWILYSANVAIRLCSCSTSEIILRL